MTAPAPRLLSVIAPCRNEAAFIDAFCDSVLRQQRCGGPGRPGQQQCAHEERGDEQRGHQLAQ